MGTFLHPLARSPRRCFSELLTQPVSCFACESWQKHSLSNVVVDHSQIPYGCGPAFVHRSLETKLILWCFLQNIKSPSHFFSEVIDADVTLAGWNISLRLHHSCVTDFLLHLLAVRFAICITDINCSLYCKYIVHFNDCCCMYISLVMGPIENHFRKSLLISLQ